MPFLAKNPHLVENFSAHYLIRYTLYVDKNWDFYEFMPYMGVRTVVPQSPGKFYYAHSAEILRPGKGLKVSFNILNLKYLGILKIP